MILLLTIAPLQILFHTEATKGILLKYKLVLVHVDQCHSSKFSKKF